MSVIPVAKKAEPGERVQVNTHVAAVDGKVTAVTVKSIKVTPAAADLGGECLPPFKPAGGCLVGDVAGGSRNTVTSTVKVGKGLKKTVAVKLTVTVSAAGLKEVVTPATITYVVPKPSQKPTKTPKPSPSKSSSSGTGGGSGGGSGSSGGSSSSGSGTSGYVPPSPNSSFDTKNPQVALPPIQAPSPSVAPSPVPGAGTPHSRLQGNKSPVAQDLTFERMASTQVAWLAALMVAFSLLLTQLRLGRRRVPAGAAKRVKGTHRRPRRGMFGK